MHTNTALVIIDLQNDYFPGGKYPLWNAETTLTNVLTAIEKAKQRGDAIVLVQHVADPNKGMAPFFNQGTKGVEIHPAIREALPNAPVIVKHFADSFEKTQLSEMLSTRFITRLLICGMMTQNCVTHTAISKASESYDVTVISDCCTTVDEMIHAIALNALSTRVQLKTIAEEWG